MLTAVLCVSLTQAASDMRAQSMQDASFFDASQTKKGVVLKADRQNYLLCDANAKTLIGPSLARDPLARFWIYEMSGNEPDTYDGSYYFSHGELSKNPKYAPMATLGALKKLTWYYVMTDTDLYFRCDTGLEHLYECGNGLTEGEQWSPDASVTHLQEECDDANDDDHDGCGACAVTDGWSCEGSPSVCRNNDAEQAAVDPSTRDESMPTAIQEPQKSSPYAVTVSNTLSDAMLKKISAPGSGLSFLSLLSDSVILAAESELDQVDSTQTIAGFRFASALKNAFEINGLIFEIEARNVSIRAYASDGTAKMLLSNPAADDKSVPCEVYLNDTLPLPAQSFTGKAFVVCTELASILETTVADGKPLMLELTANFLDTSLDADASSWVRVRLDRFNNPLMRGFGITRSHVMLTDAEGKTLYWMDSGQEFLTSRLLSRSVEN